MTEFVRLTLVSHAMTDAMAAGRFPADEPLNDTGLRVVEAVAALDITGGTRQLTGPERRARQTAQLLCLQATTEPRLADLDCGRWRGEALSNIGPADLEAWLTEPAHAPHGGESIADLIERVEGWLECGGDTSGGDPVGDPAGAWQPTEIVLAHGHCATQPHRHALPGRMLDAAVVVVIAARSTQRPAWRPATSSPSPSDRDRGASSAGS